MLALDPNERFAADVSTDDKAKFWFRYLSGRQYRAACGLDVLRRESSPFDPAVIEELYRTLKVSLVGWEGLDVPFDVEKIDDVTTPTEAWQLYYKSLSAGRLSVTEKNGSGSESDASSIPSASAAGLENAPTG